MLNLLSCLVAICFFSYACVLCWHVRHCIFAICYFFLRCRLGVFCSRSFLSRSDNIKSHYSGYGTGFFLFVCLVALKLQLAFSRASECVHDFWSASTNSSKHYSYAKCNAFFWWKRWKPQNLHPFLLPCPFRCSLFTNPRNTHTYI